MSSAALIPRIQDLVADRAKEVERAHAELDAANSSAESAQTAVARAEAAYAASPDDGEATLKARNALHLAQVRQAAKQKQLTDAESAHATVVRSLGAAKLAKRKDELREAASAETYAQASAPHVQRLLAAIDELRVSSEAIDTAYSASIEAANSLRSLGENYPSLDSAHVLLAALDELADRGVAIDDDTLVRLRHRLDVNANKPKAIGRDVSHVVELVESYIRQPVPSADRLAAFKRRLDLIRKTRTYHEAFRSPDDEAATINEWNESFPGAVLNPSPPPSGYRYVRGPDGRPMLTNSTDTRHTVEPQ